MEQREHSQQWGCCPELGCNALRWGKGAGARLSRLQQRAAGWKDKQSGNRNSCLKGTEKEQRGLTALEGNRKLVFSARNPDS